MPHRLIPAPLRVTLMVSATAIVMACVAAIVAEHTIEMVSARHLLPRWDLATHLGHGWVDYHLLATGQIHLLLWDLWLQGYWPPMLSIVQMPFYLVLGGQLTSGLWSGLAAFILVGVAGVAIPRRHWHEGTLLPGGLFLALMASSPFLLAYASVAMTEMLGAATQLLVILAWVHYRRTGGPGAARLFAVSLTVLFFTKYNYFLLLVGPLILHEWLERTAGQPLARRVTQLGRRIWRVISTPTGGLVLLYVAALFVIQRTGGFEFQVLGQRVSVHSAGNSGYVVFYALLARLWYAHRRGHIDWPRLMAADPRVRPLVRWFGVPVAIWMASPYPNHIRDFTNLVFNRPLGEPGLSAGLSSYAHALRTSYFYNEWILAGVAIAFAVAAVRYRRQPPFMQWLILAVPLQGAVIALHQTRFTRFLLLTVVLLCLAAAIEAGRWLAGSSRARLLAGVLAAVAVASGVMAARQVVARQPFLSIAFEHYTDSPALRVALDTIRAELTADDRLVVVGQSDPLSPALFRWELGPPAGVPCFPYETGGSRGIALARATRVLLVDSAGTGGASLDVSEDYLRHRRGVMEQVGRGELVVRDAIPVPDMGIVLRTYDRTPLPQAPPCRQWPG